MTKIKIISNPYQKEITFKKWDEQTRVWKGISYDNNLNSKLISDKLVHSFW